MVLLCLAALLGTALLASRSRGPTREPAPGQESATEASPVPASSGPGPTLSTARRARVVAQVAEVDEDFDPLGPSFVVGQLVDPQGRALANIPLYLGFEIPATYEIPDQRILFAAGWDVGEGHVVAARYGDRETTDSEGRFRIKASSTRHMSSGDGKVRVVPAHPGWMDGKWRRASEGGRIQADAAISLAVHVVDETGSPVPEFHAVIQEPSRRGDHGVPAKNGGFVVQWRRGTTLPESVEPKVVVWARGRRVERRSLVIRATDPAAKITIDLGPSMPDGLLVLSPSSQGADELQPTVVVLSLPERPDDPVLRVGLTRSEAGASFSAAVPPGRFRVKVFARAHVRRVPVIDEEMEFTSQATVERRWESRR